MSAKYRAELLLPAGFGLIAILALTACAPSTAPMVTSVNSVGQIHVSTSQTPTISPTGTPAETATPPTNYQNGTYLIEGHAITLVDGLSEVEIAPGSSSKSVTRYIGFYAAGDLNGDGKEDAVFLLTQDNGGSGTFYYVTTALSTELSYKGTNGIFLGDRIAPLSTQIEDGRIVVRYKDRNPNDSFAVEPAVDFMRYFKVFNNSLSEVDQP